MSERTVSRTWLAVVLLLALGGGGLARAESLNFPLGGDGDLRLLGNRFQVAATWRTPDGRTGAGHALQVTRDTGMFWFFDAGNLEVTVKVIDACAPPFESFWVFGAGLTNLAVTVTVTDFATGTTKTYLNAQGRAFLPLQDAGAFAACPDPTPHACGQGTVSEVAATPRADATAENLAFVLSGAFTAWPWVYDRVLADLQSIRVRQPALATTGFLPSVPTSSLIVTFRPDAFAQVVAGTYHGWDCLNSWYAAHPPQVLASNSVAILTFPGVFDIGRVRQDYVALPGVSAVAPNATVFGNPFDEASFCAAVDGRTFKYFARDQYGLTYYHFTSQPGEAPVSQGSFTLPSDPTPPWAQDAYSCFIHEVAFCCVLS
ncbi:MAG TPA: hypothetical protein VOA87_00335 [Thermoanaerobaculia bacterium]|nr:hypothetical protein [Thermoanaerobaculia bacterium]